MYINKELRHCLSQVSSFVSTNLVQKGVLCFVGWFTLKMEPAFCCKILSWNLHCRPPHTRLHKNRTERIENVCQTIQRENPTLVSLQEVGVYEYNKIHNHFVNIYGFHSVKSSIGFVEDLDFCITVVMFKKDVVFHYSGNHYKFHSLRMCEYLHVFQGKVKGNEFVLFTSQLEKRKSSSKERQDQLGQVIHFLNKTPATSTAIFAGSLYITDFELEKEMSQRDERNVCELWKELKLKKSFNENLNTGDISKGVEHTEWVFIRRNQDDLRASHMTTVSALEGDLPDGVIINYNVPVIEDEECSEESEDTDSEDFDLGCEESNEILEDEGICIDSDASGTTLPEHSTIKLDDHRILEETQNATSSTLQDEKYINKLTITEEVPSVEPKEHLFSTSNYNTDVTPASFSQPSSLSALDLTFPATSSHKQYKDIFDVDKCLELCILLHNEQNSNDTIIEWVENHVGRNFWMSGPFIKCLISVICEKAVNDDLNSPENAINKRSPLVVFYILNSKENLQQDIIEEVLTCIDTWGYSQETICLLLHQFYHNEVIYESSLQSWAVNDQSMKAKLVKEFSFHEFPELWKIMAKNQNFARNV
nr:uncharacterized protein LOC100182543 [Ciona intestinalis]|eukprot:XP_002128397.3 uncharacterized protein LOC100182543 [Ciona intestinalis]